MKDACPNAPTISVVICAYTEARWDDLRRAVTSAQRQSLAPSEILLVIDHNDALLRRAQADMPGVVVLENQERRGLSGARNTGVKVAQGDLIAFLDDDAIAEPDWLRSLAQACSEPHVLGCGGLVEPMWLSGKPAWFPEEFNWVVGCSYRGLPGAQSAVRNPIGSSMLIRREVFEAIGGFRSEVGRVGKHPVGCEETELCIRARQHWPGGMFVYEPASRIKHVVPDDRAQWSYFRSRCFYEGRSKAQVARAVGAHDGLASERSYTLRTLPSGVFRNILHALTHDDVYGLARAGAIVAGLAITALGYASGVFNQALMRSKAALRESAPVTPMSGQEIPSLVASYHQGESD
jgi:GT2 family glycosyltransferase